MLRLLWDIWSWQLPSRVWNLYKPKSHKHTSCAQVQMNADRRNRAVHYRARLKVLAATSKAFHGLGPAYLQDCFSPLHWHDCFIHLSEVFSWCQTANGCNRQQLPTPVLSPFQILLYGMVCLRKSGWLCSLSFPQHFVKLNYSTELFNPGKRVATVLEDSWS